MKWAKDTEYYLLHPHTLHQLAILYYHSKLVALLPPLQHPLYITCVTSIFESVSVYPRLIRISIPIYDPNKPYKLVSLMI